MLVRDFKTLPIKVPIKIRVSSIVGIYFTSVKIKNGAIFFIFINLSFLIKKVT
jgi:hypothetical protein